MDNRTKKEIGAVTVVGLATLIGIAYTNRRKIQKGYDIKRYNFLNWKDNTTQNILSKAEQKVKDLQDKTISERQIAW